VARKDPSKRDRCDICGTALDEEAVIQEFPDGSLVRLCQDCAEGAALDDEEGAGDQFEADDSTAEWTSPTDDQPTAVDLFADEPPSKSKRPQAEGAQAEPAKRFQAEVFDADLFDMQHAGPEEANGEFDGEEEPPQRRRPNWLLGPAQSRARSKSRKRTSILTRTRSERRPTTRRSNWPPRWWKKTWRPTWPTWRPIWPTRSPSRPSLKPSPTTRKRLLNGSSRRPPRPWSPGPCLRSCLHLCPEQR